MLVDKSIEICTSKKKDLNLIQSKKKLSIVGITFSMILILICVDIEKVDITVVVDTQKVDGNRNVEIKIMSNNIIKKLSIVQITFHCLYNQQKNSIHIWKTILVIDTHKVDINTRKQTRNCRTRKNRKLSIVRITFYCLYQHRKNSIHKNIVRRRYPQSRFKYSPTTKNLKLCREK